MALKFRRGTTAQQSGSLEYGEPYVNTTLGTLLIGGVDGDIVLSSTGTGSTGNFGPISGSGLDITGDANIAGNLTLGGQLTIGDNISDTVNVVASLSSSLIPAETNAFDLGSADKIWKDLYVSTGSIKFVAGNTVVGTLESNANGDIIAKEFRIKSGSNPQIIFENETTGKEYHIQNGDSGNFIIHNGITENAMMMFTPTLDGHGNARLYGDLDVSKSLFSPVIQALHVTGSLRDLTIGSLVNYSASVDSNLKLLQSATSSANSSIVNLNTYTASNDIINSTQNSRLDQLSTDSGSAIGRLNILETKATTLENVSASLLTYTASNDITNATQNSRLDQLSTDSGSQNSRLVSLENASSTLATTGSNLFIGNQTITGSMYISGDMIVQGSSSLQNISASAVSIGTNIVKLNTDSPAVRFAGLQVVDSGSTQMSSSLFWDSLNNHWVYQRESGSVYGGGMLISGPRNLGALGDEVGMTSNRVAMGIGGDHISSSGMWTDGNNLSIPNNLEVSGSITATTLVGSISATNGVVSGSSQVVGILSSLNTYTSSNDTTNGTQNSRLDQLSTASGSAIGRLNTLEIETANLETFSSSILSYVSSNDTTNSTQTSRLDQLSTASGSAIGRLNTLEIETANLETFSSSAISRLNTLEGKDITITLTGEVTGTGTITDLGSVSFATTIAANSVALGTDTTGNYVGSLVAGTNITLTNNSGEGATPTIGLTNNTISGIALGSNLGTLTIGNGLSGTSYNGSAGVTIANAGVTSNVAGTGVSVSGGTGAVTISIGQSVATSANAQFNSLGIGMAASATAGRIDATNDIVAFSSSDIRFKENIIPIENALDKISKISGNTYDWKAENKIEHGYEGNDVGVIAQEIEAVLPQLVQTRENGFKAVKYDKLVALLIEGIKEQQLQIELLRIDLNNSINKGL